MVDVDEVNVISAPLIQAPSPRQRPVQPYLSTLPVRVFLVPVRDELTMVRSHLFVI